jgi:putative transcriptional regulator
MRVKLVKLREGRGYTQQTFSEAVGISRSHYSQIETGEKEPSLKVSLKIKRVLDYPYDDIFFNQKCPVLGRR